MKHQTFLLTAVATLGVISSDNTKSMGAESAQANPAMSFFVTSTGSKTANLGGLRGADKICQNLASGVGLGNKTWHAYLSAERDTDNGNKPTDARSRIGTGRWSNSKGVVVAKNLDEPARPQRRCGRISRRTRPACSRQLAELAKTRCARHPNRLDGRR